VAIIASFVANPAQVKRGQTTTLSWSVSPGSVFASMVTGSPIALHQWSSRQCNRRHTQLMPIKLPTRNSGRLNPWEARRARWLKNYSFVEMRSRAVQLRSAHPPRRFFLYLRQSTRPAPTWLQLRSVCRFCWQPSRLILLHSTSCRGSRTTCGLLAHP
jgi:hypothetical protein